MIENLSLNTKAILLLTAPLIAGKSNAKVKPLTPGEYEQLARRLQETQAEPSDLLKPDADTLKERCGAAVGKERLAALLGRGFLLSQAVEYWRTRAIWVVSRADDSYPRRLKERLKRDAPILLYGCGEIEIAASRGSLVIVGSRNVDDSLNEYARDVASLSAKAGRIVVSGAARGIDRAAMNGALEAGGKAVGVLAGDLERMTMNREHRNLLLEKRLLLISPYDPRARFNVGHAMQRNKTIYALAEATLVVNATANSGGTWAGAIEQLRKYPALPVYVRSIGESSEGIEALQHEGAVPWPNPDTPKALKKILDAASSKEYDDPVQRTLTIESQKESAPVKEDRQAESSTPEPCDAADSAPVDELFGKIMEQIERMDGPKTKATVANKLKKLRVSETQSQTWLNLFAERKIRELFKSANACKTEEEISKEIQKIQVSAQIRRCLSGLVKEKFLDKIPGRPVKYCSGQFNRSLFDQRN